MTRFPRRLDISAVETWNEGDTADRMKPLEFPQQTAVLAKDQPEYQPLPVYRADDGEVISCWQLTWRDVFRLMFTRKLWLRQLTFNQLLQHNSRRSRTRSVLPTNTIKRNASCPCSSGKKTKRCCIDKIEYFQDGIAGGRSVIELSVERILGKKEKAEE